MKAREPFTDAERERLLELDNKALKEGPCFDDEDLVAEREGLIRKRLAERNVMPDFQFSVMQNGYPNEPCDTPEGAIMNWIAQGGGDSERLPYDNSGLLKEVFPHLINGAWEEDLHLVAVAGGTIVGYKPLNCGYWREKFKDMKADRREEYEKTLQKADSGSHFPVHTINGKEYIDTSRSISIKNGKVRYIREGLDKKEKKQ